MVGAPLPGGIFGVETATVTTPATAEAPVTVAGVTAAVLVEATVGVETGRDLSSNGYFLGRPRGSGVPDFTFAATGLGAGAVGFGVCNKTENKTV